MKTVLVVFGTRPEAIKMCPLIHEIKASKQINCIICVTGQHRHMLDQVLEGFSIRPDYDLSVMKDNQSLHTVTAKILCAIEPILSEVKPDLVLVHGDTTTAFSTALACFYQGIPLAHVEAGLRTNRLDSPFPEEFNRRSIGMLASYHFAPTERAKHNLLSEGVSENSIFVTGNTVIDALKTTIRPDYTHPELSWASDSRLILITAHRRENLGKPLADALRAIRRVIEKHPEIKAIYPLHKNPLVRQIALEALGDCPRIHLIEPLPVLDFHNFLARCDLVLTDSGGIQEEAPALAKPVLLLRDTTERPEVSERGNVRAIGTREEDVFSALDALLTSNESYHAMASACTLYGDGFASRRILRHLEAILGTDSV